MEQNPLAPHIKRGLLGILAQTQRDGATELVMAPTSDGGTSWRCNVGGTWHEAIPSPFLQWPMVVSELAGLAGIRDAPCPKEGIIYVAYSGVRLRWQLNISNETSECVLHNVGKDMR